MHNFCCNMDRVRELRKRKNGETTAKGKFRNLFLNMSSRQPKVQRDVSSTLSILPTSLPSSAPSTNQTSLIVSVYNEDSKKHPNEEAPMPNPKRAKKTKKNKKVKFAIDALQSLNRSKIRTKKKLLPKRSSTEGKLPRNPTVVKLCEAPPTRSMVTSTHKKRLPILYGLEKELIELKRALVDKESIFITGGPGCGKTALVNIAAKELGLAIEHIDVEGKGGWSQVLRFVSSECKKQTMFPRVLVADGIDILDSPEMKASEAMYSSENNFEMLREWLYSRPMLGSPLVLIASEVSRTNRFLRTACSKYFYIKPVSSDTLYKILKPQLDHVPDLPSDAHRPFLEQLQNQYGRDVRKIQNALLFGTMGLWNYRAKNGPTMIVSKMARIYHSGDFVSLFDIGHAIRWGPLLQLPRDRDGGCPIDLSARAVSTISSWGERKYFLEIMTHNLTQKASTKDMRSRSLLDSCNQIRKLSEVLEICSLSCETAKSDELFYTATRSMCDFVNSGYIRNDGSAFDTPKCDRSDAELKWDNWWREKKTMAACRIRHDVYSRDYVTYIEAYS